MIAAATLGQIKVILYVICAEIGTLIGITIVKR